MVVFTESKDTLQNRSCPMQGIYIQNDVHYINTNRSWDAVWQNVRLAQACSNHNLCTECIPGFWYQKSFIIQILTFRQQFLVLESWNTFSICKATVRLWWTLLASTSYLYVLPFSSRQEALERERSERVSLHVIFNLGAYALKACGS